MRSPQLRPLWSSESSCNCSVIFGRAIKNEYLALGTLIGTVGLSVLAAGGGKKDAPAAKPTLEQVKDSVKIDASSKYVVPRFLYTGDGY